MNANQTLRDSINSVKPIAGALSEERGTLLKLMAQLNIDSIRVSVVHRLSHKIVNSWSLSSTNDLQTKGVTEGSDSQEIEAPELDHKFGINDSLRLSDPGQTKTRQVSPHLWLFTWLAGSAEMVSAKVRYPQPREFVDEKDAALARLLFLHLAQEQALESKPVKTNSTKDLKLSIDNQRSFRRLSFGLLLLLSACALLSGWLALFALPAADTDRQARQTEASHWQAMTDLAVIEHLSKMLAAGDYGDLQDELSEFHSMGFYSRGVVVNASNRVIALAGDGNAADVGQAMPAALPSTIQSVPLKQGKEVLGHFIYPQRSAPSEIIPFFSLRYLGAGIALLAFFAAVAFLLLMRRDQQISLGSKKRHTISASREDK